MKISYFETGRYRAPETLPGQWPMPSGAYDSDAGAQVYQGMLLGNLSPASSPGAMWKKARQDWTTIGRMPHAGAAFLFSITVPLAVLFFEIYVHYHGEMPGTLAMVAYLVMVGGAAMYYLLFVAHYNWQNQFQDYRALAEAMRVLHQRGADPIVLAELL